MNYPSHLEEIDKDIKLGVKWPSRKDAEPSGVWYAYSFAYDAVEQKDKSRWVSTKIKYEDERKANRNRALRLLLPAFGRDKNPLMTKGYSQCLENHFSSYLLPLEYFLSR